MKLKIIAVITLLFTSAGACFAQQGGSLTGAWRITQTQGRGPNGRTQAHPQPGFILFTAKHYSIVSVTSDNPRPPLPEDVSKATADQLRATWGPFVANSGTYEAKDGVLELHPALAKTSPSGQTWSYKIEGATLTLTPTKGLLPSVPILKLTRAE